MMSKRCLRQKPRISYFEPEEPSLDEYVFCEKCADYVYEYCSLHGALLVIPDDKVPAKPNFPSYVPRAALTIPHVFLHLNYSTIPGAGLGVFTTLTLPCGVRFGPYRGERTKDITSDYSWQIYDGNNKPSHVVDAADGNRSNWMRYVNCARHWSEQNLIAFQYQGQLYYRTIRIIPRFTELMVFYGSEYANILKIDLGRYNSPKSYAQKFGAPARKHPRFGVKNKKPLQALVLKPPEEIKECNITATTNTTTPSNVAQNITKNTNVSEVAKLQSQKGSPAPKKLKINKKSQPKNIASLKPNVETDQVENPVKAKCKETQIKAKNKKKTVNIEQKLCKDMQTAGMKENFVTKSLINTKREENIINVNTDIIKPVHDNTILNKNNDVINSNSPGSSQMNQSSLKTQNACLIRIQDAYFCCDVCNHQSITKDTLVKHMLFHDMNRMFPCDKCSYRFSTNVSLIKHKAQLHDFKGSPVKMHECNICDYTTVSQNDLNDHLLKHAGIKRYECDKCECTFVVLPSLKRHLRTHTLHTLEKPYKCNVCNYKSTLPSNLKRHLRTHTGEKPYKCNVCNYKCIQSSTLKTHLSTHTGEKPYKCNVCNYKSTRPSHLKRHLRTHTGEKPYKCNVCNYKCIQSSTLKTHLSTHTGEKPYKCNVCNYKSTRPSHLKRHLRTHTGEKPYKCNVCNYKCIQSSTLKTHLRTHTGEKPYKCNVCNYKSTRPSTLKTHLRTHTGEKPYKCNVCNYKSTRPSNLKTHLRTHTGEKPYKCNVCNYQSTHSSTLKTHLRTHTGEKPYKCNVCNYKGSQLSNLKTHNIRTHNILEHRNFSICRPPPVTGGPTTMG